MVLTNTTKKEMSLAWTVKVIRNNSEIGELFKMSDNTTVSET